MRKPPFYQPYHVYFTYRKMLLEISDGGKILNENQAWYFQLRLRKLRISRIIP